MSLDISNPAVFANLPQPIPFVPPYPLPPVKPTLEDPVPEIVEPPLPGHFPLLGATGLHRN